MDVLERTGVVLNWGFGLIGAAFLVLSVLFAITSYRVHRGYIHNDYGSTLIGIYSAIFGFIAAVFLAARWAIFG